MKNTLLTTLAFAVLSLGLVPGRSATAQNAILAQMYGRGVHAYYAGNYNDAMQYLSMAIENGIQDPRAYYFRGMTAHASGRPYEADTDWQTGAEMEASGRTNASIGRSLARFQGSARLKLEEIRQKARLQALATANARSQQRYGELKAAESAPGAAAAAAPPPPAATPPAAVTPPPTPPAAEDPFADDMAEGQAEVASDDAFKGAMEDPFAGDASAGPDTPPADGTDPFGGDAGGGADPFGGDSGGADDPFGGGDDGGAMDDPFGGGDDSGGADDDPFGGNPFG